MTERAEPRWLDADGAARHLSLRVDAFLRRVARGTYPKPSYGAGERTPRWWSGDLDAVMRPDTASTDPRLAVEALAQKEAEKGRARRQAHAR